MRPRGVTFIGVGLCVIALYSLLIAFLSLMTASALGAVLSGYIGAAILVAIALLCFIAARGLFYLKPWGFWLTVGLLALNTLFGLFLVFATHNTLSVGLLLCAVAFIYLLTNREVRLAFFG